jgi:hypothetical protein
MESLLTHESGYAPIAETGARPSARRVGGLNRMSS